MPEDEAKRARTLGPRPEAPERSPRVLLAEDDDQLRVLFRRALEDAGFDVLAAVGGEEALELARRSRGGIDILVTDVEMPGIGGPELAARVSAEAPRLPVVYVTASPGFVPEASLRQGHTLLLTKPIHLDELVGAVSKLVRRQLVS